MRNGALRLYEAEGKCIAKADHSRSHAIQAIELVCGRNYLQATQNVRYKNVFKLLSIIHCRRRDLNTFPYFMLPSSICRRFRLCCAHCLRRRRHRQQVPPLLPSHTPYLRPVLRFVSTIQRTHTAPS